MERTLCIAAVLCAAIAFAGWYRARGRHGWLALRVRLVEQRERDAAVAAREFAAASRGSSNEVLTVLDRTLRRLDPAVDAMLAFVPDGAELRCAFASGERALYYAGLRLRRDRETLVARAAASRQRIELQAQPPMLVTDRTAVAAPLAEEDALIGVVYVSSSRAFAFDNPDALARAIDYAAVPYAIAVEREHDRMEATYDALTGLLTASAFRARLSDEIARTKVSAGGRLAVWFIDTDDFKAVNDAFGHAAGDAVLRAMARLLRAHAITGADLVGRNGGDEICAMLSNVAKTTAIERAQKFCDAVRCHVFEPAVRITVSIGVASYPLDSGEVGDLLEIADAAMYHAKRCGRDRVAFAVERSRFRTFQ